MSQIESGIEFLITAEGRQARAEVQRTEREIVASTDRITAAERRRMQAQLDTLRAISQQSATPDIRAGISHLEERLAVASPKDTAREWREAVEGIQREARAVVTRDPGAYIGAGFRKAVTDIRAVKEEASSLEKILFRLGKSPTGADTFLEGIARAAPQAAVALGVARVATVGLEGFGAFADRAAARKRGDFAGEIQADKAFEQRITSVPIVGDLGRAIRDQVFERGQAQRIKDLEYETKQQEKINDRMAQRVELQNKVLAIGKDVLRTTEAELAARGRTSAEVGIQSAQRNLADFDKVLGDAKQRALKLSNDPTLRKARENLVAQVENAREDERRESTEQRIQLHRQEAEREAEIIAEGEEQSGQKRLAERTKLATALERKEQEIFDQIRAIRRREEETHESTGLIPNLERQLEARRQANVKALAAFDRDSAQKQAEAQREEQGREDRDAKVAADRARDREHRIADVQFEARQIELRSTHKDRTAEIEAVQRQAERDIEDAGGDKQLETGIRQRARAQLQAIQREIDRQGPGQFEAVSRNRTDLLGRLSGASDPQREAADVLKNRIAKSLEAIERNTANPVARAA